MRLADFSANKRHDTLWLALGFVLQDLAGDSGTPAVAELLRQRLDFPKSEVPMVMTWLKKVAKLVPEATQTGETVRAYGHYGRRWVWHPRRGSSSAPVIPPAPQPTPVPLAATNPNSHMGIGEIGGMMGEALDAGDMERYRAARAEMGRRNAPEVDDKDW